MNANRQQDQDLTCELEVYAAQNKGTQNQLSFCTLLGMQNSGL